MCIRDRSRSAGSLRRQQSSNDTKAAGQREGSLSVGGGSLVMRKSARSIGFTCCHTCARGRTAQQDRPRVSDTHRHSPAARR
eukprot:6132773-Prymnesium_polylepis.1